MLNPTQGKLAETIDGMVLVDAGPGTGKTHTIVERYLNIAKKEEVDVSDILMLTFTRAAAQEMEERIKSAINNLDDSPESKRVKEKINFVDARTFDSFCMSVVMDAPEIISDFFGLEEKLTRGARMSDNNTINQDLFSRFMDRFLIERGPEFGDYAVMASSAHSDIFNLVNKLMSKGIIPLKAGWFGIDFERALFGDTKEVVSRLYALDEKELIKEVQKLTTYGLEFDDIEETLGENWIEDAAEEDRSLLVQFVHDLYFDYIRAMIADNRLTYGLVSMFAFTMLYSNPELRKRHKFRYITIDEFQDTNANQLMMTLLLLSKPNLCAVGDWKQGIYGFRFVSIDNIVYFEEKIVQMKRFLNDDVKRVEFDIPETVKLSLDTNYRSSQTIIDCSFRCLKLRGSKEEKVPDENVVLLKSGREDMGPNTKVRFVQAEGKQFEALETMRAIKDYVGSGNYLICEGETARPVEFGDIAVLCRGRKDCKDITAACAEHGIPAYYAGDYPVMNTREGRLAMAWLKLVNNEQDPWGYMPILEDRGYSLNRIEDMKDENNTIRLPCEIAKQRRALTNKRRRITELLSSVFKFYGLDNDYTNAIIHAVSSVHSGSLMTISDVINMMETDIKNKNPYELDATTSENAVKIMTMHKSKGLEFPIVITPYIDRGSMPSTNNGKGTFFFDEILGIRCQNEVVRVNGYPKIVPSWKTKVANKAVPVDYYEERRLFFVATSRAKQYLTVISGYKPSTFMTDLSEGKYEVIPQAEISKDYAEKDLTPAPEIGSYGRRRRKFGIHELMDFASENGTGGMAERDEFNTKGPEYGEKVHGLAYMLLSGTVISEEKYEEFPEMTEVQSVLDSLKDADLLGEIDCGLPIDGTDVLLRGRIDLIAIWPDRIEIHDYKTDESDRFEEQYRFQLSVYAQAASGFYNRPAKCVIDYVSTKKRVDFDPWPMDRIKEWVKDRV